MVPDQHRHRIGAEKCFDISFRPKRPKWPTISNPCLSVSDIAERISKDPFEIDTFLLEMSKKCQVMPTGKPGAYKFMVGIIAFQLKRFTKERTGVWRLSSPF
jgi:hypothetical protein